MLSKLLDPLDRLEMVCNRLKNVPYMDLVVIMQNNSQPLNFAHERAISLVNGVLHPIDGLAHLCHIIPPDYTYRRSQAKHKGG